MSVSEFAKRILNGKYMKERCDTDNLDDNMQKIIRSIRLRYYKRSKEKFPPILMYSIPGCGKTYLVRMIVQIFQDDYDYLWIDSHDIMSSLYGDTQKTIHAIFEAARNHKRPVIVFFDEIDGIFGENKDSHQVDYQNITTFKQETDGNKDNSNIVILCATNHIDRISEAIKSRLSSQYEFHLPNDEQRKKFFKNKFATRCHNLNENDFWFLSRKTNNKSFRDLEKIFDDLDNIANLLNEESEYFVIGHGIDKEGNERDGLYVAVKEGTQGSFKVEGHKKTDFINNTAQIPISRYFINFYFQNPKSNDIPNLPFYSGPIFNKNFLKEKQMKIKKKERENKILAYGYYIIGIILFVTIYLPSKIIFNRQNKNYKSLRFLSPIVSFVISFLVMHFFSSKRNDDVEELGPATKCIRNIATKIGEIIVDVVIPFVIDPIINTYSNVYQSIIEFIAWPIKTFIFKPVQKIIIQPLKMVVNYCMNVYHSIRNIFRNTITNKVYA